MTTDLSKTLSRTQRIATSIPSDVLEALLVDLLNQQGELHYPLIGQSMQPTIPADSLLTVRPLTTEPAAGDLLVFVWAGQLVAHRLMRTVEGVDGKRWITQGDNCALPDPVLTSGRVIGRVVAATYHEQLIWPSSSQTFWRWRWIIRYYFFAAMRHLRRIIHRRIA